jgi:hypothetical protein
LLLCACAAPPKPAPDTEARVVVAPPEPEPHYHDYPEIPPDELGTPAEAGAPEPSDDCPLSEVPPPAPAPRIQSGPPVTNRVPPELIMKPIRARAACMRGCYRAGLARDPKLSGRIAVRFVVDIDGWVRRARVADDEMGDAEVADCVRRVFVGLRYPEPSGGPVTVVYPVVFQP